MAMDNHRRTERDFNATRTRMPFIVARALYITVFFLAAHALSNFHTFRSHGAITIRLFVMLMLCCMIPLTVEAGPDQPVDTVSAGKKEGMTYATLALPDMHIEVNISRRELYVFNGKEKISTYPVAVGKPEWPTRTGNWAIYEVVWNPWWYPPEEEWAWYLAIMAPGDPDNPLGSAQLIYDAPRSIHGTIEPGSIGKAVSHGSIRVTNEVAIKLARQVMESAGIVYAEEWFEEVKRDRSRNVRIHLAQRIPIRVFRER